MTDICIDTEFVEDGSTIKLLSIGLVAADGAELYRVVDDDAAISAAVAHPWVRANVLPSLPVTPLTASLWTWDEDHPDAACVHTRRHVAEDVKNFILSTEDPQLWADYGAYDHVALAQLFGPMIDLPQGIPMWTADLRQEWARAGKPDLPSLPGVTEHNALSDAREVMFRLRWLREHYGDGAILRRLAADCDAEARELAQLGEAPWSAMLGRSVPSAAEHVAALRRMAELARSRADAPPAPPNAFVLAAAPPAAARAEAPDSAARRP